MSVGAFVAAGRRLTLSRHMPVLRTFETQALVHHESSAVDQRELFKYAALEQFVWGTASWAAFGRRRVLGWRRRASLFCCYSCSRRRHFRVDGLLVSARAVQIPGCHFRNAMFFINKFQKLGKTQFRSITQLVLHGFFYPLISKVRKLLLDDGLDDCPVLEIASSVRITSQ